VDTSTCNLCGTRVTPQDSRDGRAVILLKKVWCEKCQARMIAIDRRRQAAKDQGRPGPSRPRATTMRQRPPNPPS